MGIRLSGVGARKRAVHAPVVIDAVYRPDEKKKKQIKDDKEQEKDRLVRVAEKR